MIQKIVAVDLDSTLHEYMHTVALVALNEFGVRIEGPAEDWHSVFPPGLSMAEQIEVYNRCHDREYIFLTNPYPDAAKAMRLIDSMGFEIKYVSDRKVEAFDDTVEWLTKHQFPQVEGLYCSADKRSYLMEHRDRLHTVIDDRPRTLIFARYELGLTDVYSMRHEYNKNLSDIPGVHLADSWSQIIKKFTEHLNG